MKEDISESLNRLVTILPPPGQLLTEISPLDYSNLFSAFEMACGRLYKNEYYITNPGRYFGFGLDDGRKGYIFNESRESAIKNKTLMPISIPKSTSNIDLENSMRRVLLYSDITVFVLPIDFSQHFTSYSGGEKLHQSPKMFLPLIELNAKFRDLVQAGEVIFLPSSMTTAYETVSQVEKNSYSAPYTLIDRNDFLPLNCGVLDFEDMAVFENIILPYFKDIDVSELVKIKNNETPAFNRFKYFLRDRLRQSTLANKGDELKLLREEIEYEVEGLKIEYQKIAKQKFMQGVQLSVFSIAVLAILFPPTHLIAQLAGMAGSASLLELIRELTATKEKIIPLQKSNFYIPFLLAQKHE